MVMRDEFSFRCLHLLLCITFINAEVLIRSMHLQSDSKLVTILSYLQIIVLNGKCKEIPSHVSLSVLEWILGKPSVIPLCSHTETFGMRCGY